MFHTKPDVYAQLIIDDNPTRKTEIVHKTWQPIWNEYFDILVTPNSRLEFRIYAHRSFKSDYVLGQCLIFLNKLMQETNNPKFNNIEKTFDLILDNKGKTGCIDVIFNGVDSNNLRQISSPQSQNQIPPSSSLNNNSNLFNNVSNNDDSASHSTVGNTVPTSSSSSSNLSESSNRTSSNNNHNNNYDTVTASLGALSLSDSLSNPVNLSGTSNSTANSNGGTSNVNAAQNPQDLIAHLRQGLPSG